MCNAVFEWITDNPVSECWRVCAPTRTRCIDIIVYILWLASMRASACERERVRVHPLDMRPHTHGEQYNRVSVTAASAAALPATVGARER